MGAKRPLQEENYPELSFKQPKQLDFIDVSILHKEDFPSPKPTMTVDSPADNELEASAPRSLFTSSCSEEDAVYEGNSFLSRFPSIPKEPVEQFEDPYVSLLNSFPIKQVPVGPGHQAEIPQWNMKHFSGSDRVPENDKNLNLIGTCVIPMPDLNDSVINILRASCCRTNCKCLDTGSLRCVQQHVKESRENLQDALGEDKFVDLGFFDMGEEVACKWTPYDEQVFHEVIFSNPGINFWKQLTVVFPNRTKMEIVSYYFNVFMLRRRAVQNRSYLLEIDSDDDKEQRGAHKYFNKNRSFLLDDVEYNNDYYYHGPIGGSYLIINNDGDDDDDDNSMIESFADRDLDTSWLDEDSCSGPKNVFNDVGGYGNHDSSENVEIDCGDRSSGEGTIDDSCLDC